MDVVNAGTDMAQLVPMVEQVKQRLGSRPKQWFADGGYPAHAQIDAVAEMTELSCARCRAAVVKWRKRMASEPAKELYKQRAGTAECVNAIARNHGLLQMRVRGLRKARSVVGLFVPAHNLMRIAKLAPQLISWRTGASEMAGQAA